MDEQRSISGDIDITAFLKAFASFEKIMQETPNDVVRDAAIQRFEYTFELAWKTLKRILRYRGIISNSPRSVFRDAAREHLINDPQQWFEFLTQRNQTTHVYDENIAAEIYASLPAFQQATADLICKISAL